MALGGVLFAGGCGNTVGDTLANKTLFVSECDGESPVIVWWKDGG